MTRTVTVTWTIPQEEHAFWLSQARESNFTVGEYIYVLACVHALDRYPVGKAPSSSQALMEALRRIRAARDKRAAGRIRPHS
jgi:hypothetical protein